MKISNAERRLMRKKDLNEHIKDSEVWGKYYISKLKSIKQPTKYFRYRNSYEGLN